MRFAHNDKNEKIEVSYSGERAKCRDCNSTVIGRKGDVRPKHWFHKTTINCDSWYEPITDWHLNWQNEFPLENQEITLYDEDQTIFHRADILLNNGVVIEFQNSPIKINEIDEREKFYSKKGLIWVLNGSTLANSCKISYWEKEPKIELEIEVNTLFIDKIWEEEDLKKEIFNMKTIKSLRKSPFFKKFGFWNGHRFIFEFHNDMQFEKIEIHFRSELKEICDKLYLDNREVQEDTIFKLIRKPKKEYEGVFLEKKYWRCFIDKMKSPIFLDQLEGLNNEHLYWLQENRIIEKRNFIKKYLQFV